MALMRSNFRVKLINRIVTDMESGLLSWCATGDATRDAKENKVLKLNVINFTSEVLQRNKSSLKKIKIRIIFHVQR